VDRPTLRSYSLLVCWLSPRRISRPRAASIIRFDFSVIGEPMKKDYSTLVHFIGHMIIMALSALAFWLVIRFRLFAK
jgi:hypothetical protein